MVIIEDKAQQEGRHTLKHVCWEKSGVYWERYPLPVGDYILGSPPVLDVIARKQKRGIALKKLDFIGSYKVTVDTKRDMNEIYGNIIGAQHERFRDECILAKENGIRLYVLVENNEGINDIISVAQWSNPRLEKYKRIKEKHLEGKWKKVPLPQKPPVSGEQLAKCMQTMQDKYGVKFLFCRPEDAADEVIRLLTAEYSRTKK